MFFDLNNDDYEFVNNPDHPAIDISIDKTGPNPDISAKIYLTLDLFHSYENQITIDSLPKNCYHIVTGVNNKSHISKQIIGVDFIFNRTKAYYQHYPFKPGTKKWYYLTPDAYPVLDLPSSLSKIFIFLAPNKTYGGGRVYRIYRKL